MPLTQPPGPTGEFLKGSLKDFQGDRLAFVTRCAREYGDIVSIRLGYRRIFLVNHPELIEEVLVSKSKHFSKHFALRLNPLVLGNGLLTSEGEFWLRQRRLIQPAFIRSRLAAYGPTMVRAAERVLKEWKPGETRDIANEMMRITLDIAAQTLFGSDALDSAGEVREALRFMQENFVRRFGRIVNIPIWVPTPNNLRARKSVRKLDDIIYGFIRRRRQSKENRGDLLSILLHARDEDDGKGMTDRQVRDEAMTLFLAGHETTALALGWTWYLLASNPEAEARLADELRDVLGVRPPTVADLPRLRYTEAVVSESLRIMPPVYTIGREAIDECDLGGFRVPRKTTILMSQWVVHRDPRWFTEPEKFQPERWLEDLQNPLPRFAYFPFGGGPRLCVGNTFALMEAALVLATIAQRYRFTLLPGHPIEPVASFTLRPKHGIRAVVSPRD
jgi:cytochrome P450